jgi:predicted phage-related endonuclease
MKHLINQELGNAVLLGDFENGSDEWHKLRDQPGAIGGSQVGAICGVSPWESPLARFYKATGQIPDKIEPSMSMKLGTALEAPILSIFASEHPELDIYTVGTYASKEYDWAHANADGIFMEADGTMGIIEVKFSRDYWTDGLPLHYRYQVMYYLHIFGFKKAIVVALAGSTYTEIVVEYDQFEAEAMFGQVLDFHNRVLENRPPDFDGSSSTYDAVRQVNPEINPDEKEELGELGIHLVNAYTDYQAAEKHYKEMQSRTLDAMGTSKYGMVDDRVIVYRSQRGSGAPFLNWKK